jgi:predicted alpha/beta superfamily hydrolase
MKGTLQDIWIGGYECKLYIPPNYRGRREHYPVIYMNGGEHLPEILDGIEPHFHKDCREFLLLCIQPNSWNDDFSPWPAPPLNLNEEPFGGGAFRYLNFLNQEAKPYLDSNYRTKPEPENTAVIGYSLGGLAALFSLYVCSGFGKIGSLSGSLWFEDWTEYMRKNQPKNPDAYVYLSLGKGEERSRNAFMAKVGDCTKKAAEILKDQLNLETHFIMEWNNGGHFTEIEKRFQKAILWLMQR